MKTKYFFLLGILSLFLLNSCSKDEELEQLENAVETPVMTKSVSGGMHMALSGNKISIFWNQPFGIGIGFSVTVYDAVTGIALGGYSNENDFGEAIFSINAPELYPFMGNLVALVRSAPFSDGSVEEEWTTVVNLNSDPDNPAATLCYHNYYFDNDMIRLEFDQNFSTCTVYHSMRNAGKIVMFLHVEKRIGGQNVVFDTENRTFEASIPNGIQNPTVANHITTMNISGFEKFNFNSGEYMSCEVRFYNSSCRNMSVPYNEYFPSCTHYYKFSIPIQPVGLYTDRTFSGSLTEVRTKYQ